MNALWTQAEQAPHDYHLLIGGVLTAVIAQSVYFPWHFSVTLPRFVTGRHKPRYPTLHAAQAAAEEAVRAHSCEVLTALAPGTKIREGT